MFCSILLSSLTIACTVKYCLCNKKQFLTASGHIFNIMISHVSQKISSKNLFYHFYFFNINISVII